ncbi:putative transcription factor bHLH family [Helianthus anomalus]
MGGESCLSLTDFFDSYMEAEDTDFISPLGAEDIFSTLQVLEDEFTSMATPQFHAKEEVDKSNSSSCVQQQLVGSDIKRKRQSVEDGGDGQQKVAHITVERNRRKQMNEHLTVLRSLLPCFYIKRGDQASIIGVVVDYITELQQVVQSLEAKKQRKVYGDVLSPRSPRPALPISPTTPQSAVSPYRPRFHQPNPSYLQPSSAASPSTSSSNSDIVSKSPIADVEVKFSGSNLVLKTVSPRLPGQATKIVSVLEDLSFEILHVGINIVDETMVNSFTIKVSHHFLKPLFDHQELHVYLV